MNWNKLCCSLHGGCPLYKYITSIKQGQNYTPHLKETNIFKSIFQHFYWNNILKLACQIIDKSLRLLGTSSIVSLQHRFF